MTKNAIAALAMFAAVTFAGPALAQKETSFCGVDTLPAAQLEQMYRMFKDPAQKDALFNEIDEVFDSCQSKVDKATRKKDKFRGFAFAEAMTFTFRARLVKQGYDMDRFDAQMAMACNYDRFASEESALSNETIKIVYGAIKQAGGDADTLAKDDLTDFYAYATVSSFRWRDGQELGLLSRCKR